MTSIADVISENTIDYDTAVRILRTLHDAGALDSDQLGAKDIAGCAPNQESVSTYVLRDKDGDVAWVYIPLGSAEDLYDPDGWMEAVDETAAREAWANDHPAIPSAQQRAGYHYATGLPYSASAEIAVAAENALAECNLYREIIGLEPVTWADMAQDEDE